MVLYVVLLESPDFQAFLDFIERQFLETGAGEEIRTPDLRITNALLYQLSYTGAICLFTLAQELRTAKRRRSMPEDYLFSKSET